MYPSQIYGGFGVAAIRYTRRRRRKYIILATSG